MPSFPNSTFIYTILVQIIVTQYRQNLHRESRSFSAHKVANSWGARSDKELRNALEDPALLAELVESRCGAVALGSVCLLPPLSSGGAQVP